MRKILLAAISVLASFTVLVCPVSAASLGVSPSAINLDLSSSESVSVPFQVYYYQGTVTVEAVDLPVTIDPAVFEVSGSPHSVVLDIRRVSSSVGTYSGYLRFTGQADENVALAVQVSVNIRVTAALPPAPPPVGGGGGGGGALPPSPKPIPEPTPGPVTPLPEPTPVIPPVPGPSPIDPPGADPVIPSPPYPAPEPIPTAEPPVIEPAEGNIWLWIVLVGGVVVAGGIVWATIRWWRLRLD